MFLKVCWVVSATLLLSLVCIDGASAEGGCGPGFTAGCTEDVFPTIGRSWSCLIEKEIWLAERRWRDEQQRAASERKRPKLPP
jgi:hypothetical protein